MNKVELIGRLTRGPEHRSTPGGVAVCRFTVAVKRRFANADGTHQADFIPVVAWRQTADLCARYLSKGKMVGVVGQIQCRSYDAQDGSKRYVTEVVADEVDFLSPASSGAEQQYTARQPDFEEVDDDDLPF